jgi:hypothetical protein
MHAVDDLVARLREGDPSQEDAIKSELLGLATAPKGSRVLDHLSSVMKGELLEVQWAIEEVLEAANPKPPEPEPTEEEEEEAEEEEEVDPKRPLSSADLDVVYEDPRGLVLHKAKKGERWFATQVDPRTGQPATFELHPTEVEQLKVQLQGSPYWVIGA